MRKLLPFVVLLGLAWPVAAKTVYLVDALPLTVMLQADDANPPSPLIFSYRVALDGGPALTIPATKPTPCTVCISVPWTLTTAGVHTATVQATSRGGTSMAELADAVLRFARHTSTCGCYVLEHQPATSDHCDCRFDEALALARSVNGADHAS